MEHIWTMLMHKILQNQLLCAFVANLKIDASYALYPESFCDKNLAIRKVFAFCDSGKHKHQNRLFVNNQGCELRSDSVKKKGGSKSCAEKPFLFH